MLAPFLFAKGKVLGRKGGDRHGPQPGKAPAGRRDKGDVVTALSQHGGSRNALPVLYPSKWVRGPPRPPGPSPGPTPPQPAHSARVHTRRGPRKPSLRTAETQPTPASRGQAEGRRPRTPTRPPVGAQPRSLDLRVPVSPPRRRTLQVLSQQNLGDGVGTRRWGWALTLGGRPRFQPRLDDPGQPV